MNELYGLFVDLFHLEKKDQITLSYCVFKTGKDWKIKTIIIDMFQSCILKSEQITCVVDLGVGQVGVDTVT